MHEMNELVCGFVVFVLGLYLISLPRHMHEMNELVCEPCSIGSRSAWTHLVLLPDQSISTHA